jgi:hypothetical protein
MLNLQRFSIKINKLSSNNLANVGLRAVVAALKAVPVKVALVKAVLAALVPEVLGKVALVVKVAPVLEVLLVGPALTTISSPARDAPRHKRSISKFLKRFSGLATFTVASPLFTWCPVAPLSHSAHLPACIFIRIFKEVVTPCFSNLASIRSQPYSVQGICDWLPW